MPSICSSTSRRLTASPAIPNCQHAIWCPARSGPPWARWYSGCLGSSAYAGAAMSQSLVRRRAIRQAGRHTMADTFFTAAPHWRWLIVLYFFIGGIAGGSFLLAALLDLFGTLRDRPLVRTGYYVALLGALVSGLLLTLDLERPERFWHMLIQSKRGLPMFKYWSPMSVGAWGLLLFGGVAFLATLLALHEAGQVRWTLLRPLRGRVLGSLIAVLGGLGGFFLAGYTGVLLSVTNRPLWADTAWLGLLFLLSGASTAAALLILLALRRRAQTTETVHWLSRMDMGTLLLELLVLLVLAISLGRV